MTNAEQLRESLKAVRKKIRGAKSASNKAYKSAYGIKKGVKSGNASSRRKRAKTATQATDGSISQIGRSPGDTGTGSQATDNP